MTMWRQYLLVLLLGLTGLARAFGRDFDAQLDLQRYQNLREAERYQLDLAVKQYDGQQWDAALNEFGKYLKLHKDSDACSFAQYMIGRSNENRRYVNEALKDYERVLSYYPKSREALYALYRTGQCFGKQGEFEKEKESYIRIVANKDFVGQPIVAEVLWKLSEIVSQGEKPNLAEAVEYRKRIVVEHRNNDHLYRTCVEWLARYFAMTEDDPVAAREMIVKYPGYDREQAELWVADRYLEVANAKKNNKELKGSDKYRERAREIWKTFPVKFPQATRYAQTCTARLAQSYRDDGDEKKALEIYASYLNTWPNDDNMRVQIAYYLEELKRWEDGRAEYLKLQDKLRAQWEIAYSFHRQGKADDAIANYQKVIEGDFVRYGIAMYHMADVYYYLKGDYETAMKRFVESNYSPPQHLFRVADCLIALKRYDPAVKQYAEIITFFPKNAPQAYLCMGDTYLNYLKDKEQAIKVYTLICRQYKGTGESSQAHLRLENLGVTLTEGGMDK